MHICHELLFNLLLHLAQLRINIALTHQLDYGPARMDQSHLENARELPRIIEVTLSAAVERLKGAPSDPGFGKGREIISISWYG